MSTYIAFMRAVNVGGHGVVKMDALRDAFTAAGCRNVRTFIQSGNVVFESGASEQAVVKKLRSKLATLLGTEPGIFLRSLDELSTLVQSDPFKAYPGAPDTKRYVAFLDEPLRAKPPLPLLQSKEGMEAFAMSEREVFVACHRTPSGSYGFPNNFLEKELRVAATSRNWNTVTKILKFAASGETP